MMSAVGGLILAFFFFLNFVVDGVNYHFLVAFWAWFTDLEDVVAAMEISNVFEAAFLA